MPEHMLTRDTLDATLSSMRRALDQNAAPWRSELSATPYGSDFDFAQPRAKGTVLDQLERTAILLGQLLARTGARRDRAGQFWHRLAGRRARDTMPEPAPDTALASVAAALDGSVDPRERAGAKEIPPGERQRMALHLGALSVTAAKGAATLDPHEIRRIAQRMRRVGDGLARRIDDRIAVATTREDRTELKALRDELKSWLDSCDARLHDLQPLVDELHIRSQALRNEGLVQAGRLSEVAAMTAGAPPAHDGSAFGAALRALAIRARQDITAPLHP
jgi:hypothetical protein